MSSFWSTLSRRGRLTSLAVCFTVACLLLTWSFLPTSNPRINAEPLRPVEPLRPEPLLPPVACRGPRGGFLDDPETEDLPLPAYSLPNITFPLTTTGSYEALRLEQTWMTADQRYGPYGFGEDIEETRRFSKVDWPSVDWGELQDACYQINKQRFHGRETLQSGADPRFRSASSQRRLSHRRTAEVEPRHKTGRQAIVLRAWSTFEYAPEDLWNIRAIITEASLATGGEYTVFLLVDVKAEDGAMIHEDDEMYRTLLKQSVPEEFWNIAVLFHESLQHSWYAKVGEYRPFWQIMQPLQLFAHFYPEFDHFWQFEMDTRFTGDVGKMLRAFNDFGKEEPSKQARERASWTYMPRVHGTYEKFSAAINETMGGEAAWGPVKMGKIKPIGPKMPVDGPKGDNFRIGVGQDADLLLLGQLHEVRRIQTGNDWIFKDWYRGGEGMNDPRFVSVPAQARASQELLEAIHIAQHKTGIRVPSEATLPTFALWHGLKVVGLPIPKYQHAERNVEELNFVYNGGLPKDFRDGIANGPTMYRSTAVSFFIRPMTFAWWSNLCDPVYDFWTTGKTERKTTLWPPYADKIKVPMTMPEFMKEVDGKIYVPNLIMHPRKTNTYRAPERRGFVDEPRWRQRQVR